MKNVEVQVFFRALIRNAKKNLLINEGTHAHFFSTAS